MTYEEIKELGKTSLKDLLELSHITDKQRELIIVGFCQGFLAGELNEMKRNFAKKMEKLKKIEK